LYESHEKVALFCSYTIGDKSILLSAQVGGRRKFDEINGRYVETAKQHPESFTVHTISGIGDDARAFRFDGPGDQDSVMLAVQYDQAVISTGTPVGDSRLSVAVRLAHLMLGHLRGLQIPRPR
jgi:hypothetical protein